MGRVFRGINWRTVGPYVAVLLMVALLFHVHDDDRKRSDRKLAAQTTAQEAAIKASFDKSIAAIQAVQHTGQIRGCTSRNDLRDSLTKFIDSTLDRSTRSSAATISSPTATTQEKIAAAVNLAQLRQINEDEHKALRHEVCPAA